MKKLLWILWVLISPAALGQSQYDGVWQLSDSQFATVNHNGNTMLVVGLATGDLTFAAYQGELVGNFVTLQSIAANGSITLNVTFTSDNQANVVFTSCVPNPGFICIFPLGVTIIATKIF